MFFYYGYWIYDLGPYFPAVNKLEKHRLSQTILRFFVEARRVEYLS